MSKNYNDFSYERSAAAIASRWWNNKTIGATSPVLQHVYFYIGDITADAVFPVILPHSAQIVHAAYIGCSGFTGGTTPTLSMSIRGNRGGAPGFTTGKAAGRFFTSSQTLDAAGFIWDDIDYIMAPDTGVHRYY